jgi:hypothetical protein
MLVRALEWVADRLHDLSWVIHDYAERQRATLPLTTSTLDIPKFSTSDADGVQTNYLGAMFSDAIERERNGALMDEIGRAASQS